MIRLPALVSIVCFTVAAFLAHAQTGGEQAEQREPERWQVVQCGTLLTRADRPARSNASVIVRNDRIVEVREGFVGAEQAGAPAGSEVTVVDLRGMHVLPGLIDCHVHLTFETSPEGRLRTVTDSEADAAINGVVYARRTVEAGFTTVRDVGSQGDACFALRDAINDGRLVGPRVLASGQSITPTGGHADRTNSFRPDVFGIPGPIQGVADGVEACRQAVRNQVKRGADCIKLTATGGVLSNIGAGLEQQFFDDELKAIVETAHLLKKKVAAHAHGVHGVNAALRAGVDSIEHGTFLDDESIALFKQTGAYYVPTITAGKAVETYSKIPGYYIGPVVEKARTVGPMIQNAFERAHKAGVKIAFGTDAGVFPHGENAREFVYMTEAGMSPIDCIKAATLNAAELLDIADEVGSIEAGKSADLVAVAADPLKDVSELQRVRFVMRAGAVARDER
ncbi:MAG: amidohydrolase family protein [Planctomycetota bacterium]|nr:amidohydrolase family protein [Planctomycetota bacterium]